jgi:ribose transport system permease protein
MSTIGISDPVENPGRDHPGRPGDSGAARAPAWLSLLSYRRVSALYLLAALLIFFTATTAETFWSASTFKSLFAQQSTVAVVALGLMIPLAAGGFDLSIGYVVALSSTVMASLVVFHGWATGPAALVAVGSGLVVGAFNAVLVTRFRINSFIATLATGSIVGSIIVWVSGSADISGLPQGFTGLAARGFLGVTLPAYIALLIAVIVWFVLEHTPGGRYLFATGDGRDAARLSGIRTNRILGASFVVSGLLAGIAGVMDLSRLGVASVNLGPSYLLPAFAAAFLGSTQLKGGRYNVWGALIAIIVLAVGAKGFQLLGYAFWVTDIFYGAALIVAVGLAVSERSDRFSRWRRSRRRPADAAT